MDNQNLSFCKPIPVNNLLEIVSDFDLSGVKYKRPSEGHSSISSPQKTISGQKPIKSGYIDISSSCMNQEKLLVTIDWLTVRMTQNFTLNSFKDGFYNVGDFRLELTERTPPPWKNHCFVYYKIDKYEKIGEICFNATLPSLEGTCTYKIENHVFYDCMLWEQGGKELSLGLINALGATYLNLTRLDIAVDGVDFDGFATKVLKSADYWKIGIKSNMTTILCPNDYKVTNFRVGTRKSKKMISYYNKTKEIRDRNYKKQYILDYYEANGFDLDSSVKRFELSLKSEAVHDLGGFSVEDIFDEKNLVEILDFHLEKYFEFVPTVHPDSKISRRPRIKLFDFSKVVKGQYVRVKRKLLDGLRMPKIVVKDLIKRAYFDSSYSGYEYLKSAYNLVQSFNLSGWLWEGTDRILKEFEKLALVKEIELIDNENITMDDFYFKHNIIFQDVIDLNDVLIHAHQYS